MSIKKCNTALWVALALVVGLGYLVYHVWQSKPSRAELAKAQTDNQREVHDVKSQVRHLANEVEQIKKQLPPPGQA